MSVELTLVFFLLCSGFSHLTFASRRLRVLSLPTQERVFWNDALDMCNATGASFVTLYDDEDANYTKKFVPKRAWLGLRKTRTLTWSNGHPVTFQNISVNVSNGEQLCVAIDTTWKRFACSERKPFMCDDGSNYILIKSNKSWCQALQYCRIHFVDLVSISNDTQNKNAIKAGNNTSFWIGLMLDEWEWEDGSCSSFSGWTDNKENACMCTGYVKNSEEFVRSPCGNEALPFCSKGNMRIRVIPLQLMWEQAFDYCKANHKGLLWINNQEDQTAVEEWINHTDVNGPFWIGLRQSRVFGFWIWSDRMVNFSNWRNDTTPELPMSNHCGAINNMDYKWSDEDCLVHLPFLCEEEIIYMNKSRTGTSSTREPPSKGHEGCAD